MADQLCRTEDGHARPGRAGLADRAEALDRADSGNDEAPSPRGEPRRRHDSADGRRSPRDRQRSVADRSARSALSGAFAEDDQSVTTDPGGSGGRGLAGSDWLIRSTGSFVSGFADPDAGYQNRRFKRRGGSWLSDQN